MRKYEKELNKNGVNLIAGTDEVGRGPLAGPVVTASVILPNDFDHELIIDSKKLTKKKLALAYDLVISNAIDYKIVEINVETIDKMNVKQASKYGMKLAVEGLNTKPEHVLVDYETIDIDIDQTSITKGDSLSISIAAASILAKVHRDNIMLELHELFPDYGWNTNVGYGSKKHRDAIHEIGWTEHHRKTFNPVKTLIKDKENNWKVR